MKTKEKQEYASLKVFKEALKEAKIICAKKDKNIQEYGSEALIEKNKKEKSK